MKAHLFAPPEPEPDTERNLPQRAEQKEPAREPEQNAPAKAEAQEQEPVETSDEGAQEEAEASYSSFSDLAEALGWEVDRLYDLEASTKIDGKEGKAKFRDLLKSYQLEGHLNQKLMTHADEKKAFETERQNYLTERQSQIQQLQRVQQIAVRLLDGEFAGTKWDDLATTDPVTFNAKKVDYQHRKEAIQYLDNLIAQEESAAKQKADAQQAAYLDEQRKLLETKVPEWNDKAKRDKDVADMAATFSEAYGITEADLKAIADHRAFLPLRDAMKWLRLQKSKPAVVNKVKTAPKLLKPGTQQSRAAQDGLQIQKDRELLRKTGKVQDAARVLKRQIFN